LTTYQDLKALALSLNLPGVTEAISWGNPCFNAHGKMWTWWGPQDNAAVFKFPIKEREMLCEAAPGAFFYTPHYKNHPLILMRPERFGPVWAWARLLQTWRAMAPKKVLKVCDGIAESPS
jgi:hypothetical protein